MKRLAILTLWLGLAVSAQATLITDYFEYGTNLASLVGLTTSDTFGWGANGWSGSTDPHYNATPQSPMAVALKTNIVFSGTGYANNSEGGVLLGPNPDEGTISRTLAVAHSNDVWVSALVASTMWGANGPQNRAYFQVNGDSAGNTNDWFGVRTRLLDMAVVENGVVTNVVKAIELQEKMIVAKLATDVSGVNDEMTVWFLRGNVDLSGQDVAALDAVAAWKYETATAQDIWGSSISSIGIEVRSARDPLTTTQNRFMYIDNLRISYGGLTDDAHVFEVLSGVPEPGGVLALVVLAGLLRRRMN